jgi:hypothetical protein
MNILQLPDEILRMILNHHPKQLVISQVCKRFYSISCGLKSLSMTIDQYVRKRWSLEDDSILNSILNSKRKIHSIKIVIVVDLCDKRLVKILEVVGGNVKKGEIRATKVSAKAIQLLNLMPNLERLELHIQTISGDVPDDFRMQLSKLIDLELWCSTLSTSSSSIDFPTTFCIRFILDSSATSPHASSSVTNGISGNSRYLQLVWKCWI